MSNQLELLDNRSLSKKIGKAEFRRKAQEILGFLRSEYDPFPDDTPEVQTRRKHRALSDPFFFSAPICRTTSLRSLLRSTTSW